MSVWPRFACPECAAPAAEGASGDVTCSACGERFEQRNGLYCFLGARRLAATQPFVRQYRCVRQREGYRVSTPDYYRMLPSVPPDDPHAQNWALRRESYGHLERLLADGRCRVLDLGAGNGWLSHRLASLGHRVVAVDVLDDQEDGLGACRHYPTSFPCVQADFDALPFAPSQFDCVAFNGSLHYAANAAATLERACRMLVPGGAIVVMDSPMFHSESDGHAMVAEKLRRFRAEYGLTEIVHPNVGFFTFASLVRTFGRLGLRERFIPSRGPFIWRLRREIGRIRLRRAPAAFGVWIALAPAAAPGPHARPPVASDASSSVTVEPGRTGQREHAEARSGAH